MTDCNIFQQEACRLPAAEAIALANRLLRDCLLHAPAAVSEITTHLAQAVGKGMRAEMLIYCAADAQGLVSPDAANAAAAIELLHLATLVHDDVIDDAPLRRGIASAHSRFGKKRAVITGDYLLCAAMKMLLEVQAEQDKLPDRQLWPRYAHALESVCIGELEQSQYNGDVHLSAMRYFRIISKKTAALFCLAAMGGAVVGACEVRDRKLLIRFATRFGMVFQLVDDLKDYLSLESEAQKPVKSDLAAGVITLPLILGERRDPELYTMAQEVIRSGRDAGHVIAAVRTAGGTDEARAVVERYAGRAQKVLSKLPNPFQQQALSSLLERVLASV